MNKKGFTLMEILAALVVLALVSGIGAIAYTSLVEKTKLRSFKAYEQTMYAQSMEMIMESMSDPSKENIVPDDGGFTHFTLDMLEIDKFNNPRNKNDKCSSSYVDVYRDDYINLSTHVDAYIYKVCLICPDSDYNVNGDNCTYFPNDKGNDDNLSSPPPEGTEVVPREEDTTLRGIIVKNFNSGAKYIKMYNNSNGAAMDTPVGSGNKNIYYYTGTNDGNNALASNNGNVIFGDFCWQIVRTTADGGVKLIYNGPKTTDNRCPNNNSQRPSKAGVVGTDAVKETDLSGSKIYGDGFEIYKENNTNKFRLKGTKTNTWSDATYKDLIGKYICGTTSAPTGTSDTCTALYYVGNYKSNTVASTALYTISNSVNYTQIGTSPFNAYSDSLTSVSYMFNDVYDFKSVGYNVSLDLLELLTIRYEFYYGDKAVWNSSTNKYDLKVDDGNGNYVTPTAPLTLSEIGNGAKGKYFCNIGGYKSCETVYYIEGVDLTNLWFYALPLTNGEDIETKSLTWTYATSYTKNGDSYELTNPSTVTFLLKDWVSRLGETYYRNIYVCSDFTSSTCNELYYIYEGGNVRIHYNRSSRDALFGSSVSYANGKYTINSDSDPAKYHSVWDWYKNYSTLQNSRYTCFKPEGTECGNTIYYLYHVAQSTAYYIELTDGETIETAFEKMYNNSNSSSTTLNKYNSAVKGIIDNWYESNLMPLSEYLDKDAVFCGDRAVASKGLWNPSADITVFSTSLTFKSSNVSYQSLSCNNVTDRYSSNNQYAKLNYPIGLLSLSEARQMVSSYRKTGYNYWTLTPDYVSYNDAQNGYVGDNGSNGASQVHYTKGVRPVIVLKPSIRVSGGSGTYNSPYLVKTK